MNGSESEATPRLYYYLVVGAGLATAIYAVYRVLSSGIGFQWLILASLTLPAGALVLRLPGVKAKVSISETLICTNILLFGPAAGALTAALDALFGSLRCRTSSRRLEFMIFNISSMTLSASLAGKASFMVIGSAITLPARMVPGGRFLLGLLTLALVYYLANSILVAVMVALDQRQSAFSVWSRRFLWAVVHYIAAASIAGVIALTVGSITSLSVFAVLVVLATVFLSVKSYISSADLP